MPYILESKPSTENKTNTIIKNVNNSPYKSLDLVSRGFFFDFLQKNIREYVIIESTYLDRNEEIKGNK